MERKCTGEVENIFKVLTIALHAEEHAEQRHLPVPFASSLSLSFSVPEQLPL